MNGKFSKWAPGHLFFLMAVCLILLVSVWGAALNGRPPGRTVLALLTFCLVLAVCSTAWFFFRAFRQRLSWIRMKLEGDEPRKVTLEDCMRPLEELDHALEELVAEDYNPYKIKMLHMQAEFNALQNQISPHFFYNTLETIRAKALDYGGQDIVDIVEALAMLFRFRINRTGEMATFREEMSYVDNYMLIQRYRFGNLYRFEAEYDEEDVRDCILPVLTLSPIVENAIMHGLEKKRGGGTIRLKVTATQSRMLIVVTDDGVGMPPEALEKLQQELYHPKPWSMAKESAGAVPNTLSNLNQRIHHYFGDGYGLHVFSTEGVGTTVEVMVPRM